MSSEDKNDVQKYLLSPNRILDNIENVVISHQIAETSEKDCYESDSFIEQYLTTLCNEDSSIPSSEYAPLDSLLEDIAKLESRQKVSIQSTSGAVFDIIKYWQQWSYSNPRIYRLARVILSAPSTQVTVERLFSQLKHILRDDRMRLG